MANKQSDVLEPRFDGGLINNKYVKAGLFIVKTKIQRNTEIKTLYRELDGSTTTLCYVSADRQLYELVSNPSTEGTTDGDWTALDFGIGEILLAKGTWNKDNTTPVLQDTDAVGNGNDFYVVTGAPTPVAVQYAGLFGGALVTVKDGDWVISNGNEWFVSPSPIDWNSISNVPSVITDYIGGTVITHSHAIGDVTGLQDALDLKYDIGDVGDHGILWSTVPDAKLVDAFLLKANYYERSELYTSTEVDDLLTAIQPTVAKGDISTHNGTIPSKLGVGADGFIMVADSAEAVGLKWQALTLRAAGSGMTLAGNDINLGGTAAGTITIDMDSLYDFDILNGGFSVLDNYGGGISLESSHASGVISLLSSAAGGISISETSTGLIDIISRTGGVTIRGATGAGTPQTTITLTDLLATFTDARATKVGLEYAADYSADYTLRSLTDKAYVDSVAGASIGWKLTGSFVLTGNVLKEDFTSQAAHTFTFESANATNGARFSVEPSRIRLDSHLATADAFPEGRVTVDTGIASLQGLVKATGVLSTQIAVGFDELTVTDARISPSGLQYAADYSATFGIRSLVDKNYVDNQIVSAGGWPLGGAAEATASILIDGKDIGDLEIGRNTANQGFQNITLAARDEIGTNEVFLKLLPSSSLFQTDTRIKVESTGGVGSSYSWVREDSLLLNYLHGTHATVASVTLDQLDDATGSGRVLLSTTDFAANVNSLDIKGTGTGHVFTDETFAKGLVYGADYSGNFTDRSLVDKGYVVAGFWATDGATTLTAATNITADAAYNYEINLIGQNNIVYQEKWWNAINDGMILWSVSDTVALDNDTSIRIYDRYIELGVNNQAQTTSRGANLVLDGRTAGVETLNMSVTNTSDDKSSIVLNANGTMTVSDAISSKGLVYAADYSGNFTSRSLIDKEYADGLGISGWKLTGQTDLITGSDVSIVFGNPATEDHASLTFSDADRSLSFFAADSPITESHSIVVDKHQIVMSGLTTKVGIGTNSPGAPLHVVGQAYVTTTILANAHTGYLYGGGLQFADAAATLYSSTGDPLIFATNGLGNERMRIDEDGNVGIGTDSPEHQIHQETNGDATFLMRVVNNVGGDSRFRFENEADNADSWQLGRSSDGKFRISYSSSQPFLSNVIVPFFIDTDGSVEMSPDTDQVFKFGRMQVDSRITDLFYISHVDMTGSAEYAFRQNAAGGVVFNSALGQTTEHRIGDNTMMKLKWGDGVQISTGVHLSVNTGAYADATTPLDVGMDNGDTTKIGDFWFKTIGVNEKVLEVQNGSESLQITTGSATGNSDLFLFGRAHSVYPGRIVLEGGIVNLDIAPGDSFFNGAQASVAATSDAKATGASVNINGGTGTVGTGAFNGAGGNVNLTVGAGAGTGEDGIVDIAGITSIAIDEAYQFATEVLKIGKTTSGTLVDGIGATIGFYSEVTAGAGKIGELIYSVADISGSEAGKVQIRSMTGSIGNMVDVMNLNVSTGSTALGVSASASSTDSIAVGNTASSTGLRAVAIGKDTLATDTGAIAVGDGAQARSSGSVAIGDLANSSTSANFAISIGSNTVASASNALAIGYGAEAESTNVIAIGTNAGDVTGSKGASSVSIGLNTNSGAISIGLDTVAIGTSSVAQTTSMVAIGSHAGAATGTQGVSAVSIGDYANGLSANVIGQYSVAVGSGAKSRANYAIALGTTSDASALDAIAMGHESVSSGLDSIAIGHIAQAVNTDVIAIGSGAGKTTGSVSTLVVLIGKNAGGAGSTDIGQNVVGIGTSVIVSANNAVALGRDAQVTADFGIAIGAFTPLASADGAIAVGRNMNSTSQGSILMGYHTAAMTNNRTDSFALGWDETIPSLWIEKYTTTTSGVAGSATIDIPLDTSSAYSINIQVIGGETDATPTMFISKIITGVFHREGSGSAVSGVGDGYYQSLSSAAATENVDVTLSASGNNCRITVTGPDTTSTAMSWRAVVKLTKVAIT